MWANMALAYEKLPQTVKDQIAGLRARHSIEASFGAAMPIEKRLALHAQFPDAEHPVVRTHPETGEKVLFVNASPPTSPTSTRRRTCATARTTRPAPPTCCATW
jgi:alpha-ketoglutarate-dependent taurine dioxygenase